jgi:zinc transporter ZupT
VGSWKSPSADVACVDAGVSFCGRRGWAHGLLVTLAIGLHNIPEGLAVATVLVARGSTPRKALEWTLLCALPQPLFAVPSYIFVDYFRALLPASMGFAAGCMIWIVIAELLPDALEGMPAGASPCSVCVALTFVMCAPVHVRTLLVLILSDLCLALFAPQPP